MKTGKKRKRWNPKEYSKYKMVVYFKNKEAIDPNQDDQSSTFYSFDWKSGYSRFLDPEKGLKGLHKKVREYGDKANFILIYDRTTNRLIEKYFEGEPVEI
jgi:hypothetical protein